MDCNNVNRKKRTALANALFCIEALDIRIKRNKPEKNLDEILLVLRQIQEDRFRRSLASLNARNSDMLVCLTKVAWIKSRHITRM